MPEWGGPIANYINPLFQGSSTQAPSNPAASDYRNVLGADSVGNGDRAFYARPRLLSLSQPGQGEERVYSSTCTSTDDDLDFLTSNPSYAALEEKGAWGDYSHLAKDRFDGPQGRWTGYPAVSLSDPLASPYVIAPWPRVQESATRGDAGQSPSALYRPYAGNRYDHLQSAMRGNTGDINVYERT